MSLTRFIGLVALCVLICALGVLLPYAWALRELSVSTSNPEPWAHFGTYVGGLLGPLLAFLNLLVVLYVVHASERQQHELARKRLTVDLFGEWHREPMHESRNAMGDLVANAARNASAMPSLSEIDRVDPANRPHAYRLYHFFEKWAVLSAAQQLDRPLMYAALGGRAEWWNEHFFAPIRVREHDKYILQTLALIESEVFFGLKNSP